MNIPYKESIDINFSNNDIHFMNFLHSYENELKRLLKLNKISFDKKAVKIAGVAYLVVEKTTLTIPLKNIVDTKKEIEKLQIKKQKEINNFNKLDNKLKNSSFLDKASEEIIEKFNKQSSEVRYDSELGTLYLFSSHMRHSVPMNTNESTRYSMAFDIMNNGKFGDGMNNMNFTRFW